MLRTTSVSSGKGTPGEPNRNFEKYEDDVLKQCKGKSDRKSSNETEYNSDSGVRPKTEHTSSSAFENRDSSAGLSVSQIAIGSMTIAVL